MPPKSDPKTEKRILKAAVRLWQQHGERGLTLRAVAREARTTTPTVYRRFRDKQAIRMALAGEFREQLVTECLRSASLEEACRACIRFAEERPNEYRLIWSSWNEVFDPEAPRPVRAWALAQLAQRFGGEPNDYLLSFFGVIFMAHGAAMLLTDTGDDSAREVVRSKFPLVADVFIRNAHLFQEPPSDR